MSSDKAGAKKPPTDKRGANKAGNADRNVGDALRAVYQTTVSETIPDEMLDLLNKLG